MTYGKPLTGVCVATAVFICSSLGAPILPSSPPPANAPLTMGAQGSATLTAGAPVTIHGTGFKANANISIGVYSTPTSLDALTADASGSFTDTVTIPSSFSGSHTLVAEGVGANGTARVLETAVTVRAAGSPGTLPFTGLNTALVALSGMALVVSGLALIRTAAVSRRRKRRRSASAVRV